MRIRVCDELSVNVVVCMDDLCFVSSLCVVGECECTLVGPCVYVFVVGNKWIVSLNVCVNVYSFIVCHYWLF